MNRIKTLVDESLTDLPRRRIRMEEPETVEPEYQDAA